MPLVSSGEISIGGSTTDRSINLELGRSATASSNLNETALRNLAGVSSGAISLSSFYGKSNVTFTPAGGETVETRVSTGSAGAYSATKTISCSQSATWTYTRSGSFGSADVASGGSSTTITFSLSTAGTNRYTTWSVSATAGGITRYWLVYLEVGIE